MEPALVVLVAVVSIAVAEAARAGVAVLAGDATPRAAGRLWRLDRNVELTGTIIVPALLALVVGVAFGWPSVAPVRDDGLGRVRRVLVALAAPAVHGLLAALGAVLGGDPGTALLAVNTATGLVLLLPLPPLPGGALVAALVPAAGRADSAWSRWRRGAVAPWGLAVGVVAVVSGLLGAYATSLGISAPGL